EGRRSGHSPSCRHDEVGGDRPAALEIGPVTILLLFDRGDVGIHTQIDATISHRFCQSVAQIAVEIAQDLIAAMKHGHLDATAPEDRGELHTDITSADDHDAFRQLLELETLIRADHMLFAGKVGDLGMGASRYEDSLGGDRSVARAEMHCLPVLDHRTGHEAVHAGLLQDPRVNAVQAVDLAPDIADQNSTIELEIVASPTVVLCLRELG